jgi:hypothetical protein
MPTVLVSRIYLWLKAWIKTKAARRDCQPSLPLSTRAVFVTALKVIFDCIVASILHTFECGHGAGRIQKA